MKKYIIVTCYLGNHRQPQKKGSNTNTDTEDDHAFPGVEELWKLVNERRDDRLHRRELKHGECV